MITRTHLEILRKVENTGNLTTAAQQLCLTQSALSHSIKKLEQTLNIKIWEKEGRKLNLTSAGNIMLDLGKHILPEIEHAEAMIKQLAEGTKGNLRIGMECHPCYQWLLNVISPFLTDWPDVDIDIKQKFQFDGTSALLNHDIDLLITPDPIYKSGLSFIPVFAYELVLAFAANHEFSKRKILEPTHLRHETLLTYPVTKERLDIFSQFLNPNNCVPKQHKAIESTDIMLELVSAGRGVTALPGWLVQQHAKALSLKYARLGKKGIHKEIFLGLRDKDVNIKYITGFLQLAKKTNIR